MRVHALVASLVLFASAAVAADVTPVKSLPKADEPENPSSFMFVQTAEHGTMTPISAAEGTYHLTLQGVAPQTIYFSDRPQRIAGGMALDKFLQRFPFGVENPPNAAIALSEPKSPDEDVVIVEMTKPSYDAAKKTLSYDVKVLKEASANLAFFAKKLDERLPQKFDRVSLFIDDCSDAQLQCFGSYQCHGKTCCQVSCGALGYKIGMCWSWTALSCQPCHDHSADCDRTVCTSSAGLCIKGQCTNSKGCM